MSDRGHPAQTERRVRSLRLCHVLSKHVSRVTSPGLGRWDPAWEIVKAPSEAFLDALAEWEATGKEEALDRAKTLALAVRDAWEEADQKYHNAGSPPAQEGVTA